jgi:hypothetical protein
LLIQRLAVKNFPVPEIWNPELVRGHTRCLLIQRLAGKDFPVPEFIVGIRNLKVVFGHSALILNALWKRD